MMYTFITEMLESIYKNNISSQLHLSEQKWERKGGMYIFEKVIVAAIGYVTILKYVG